MKPLLVRGRIVAEDTVLAPPPLVILDMEEEKQPEPSRSESAGMPAGESTSDFTQAIDYAQTPSGQAEKENESDFESVVSQGREEVNSDHDQIDLNAKLLIS